MINLILNHFAVSGETVIADRYAYSGAAFTAAKGKQRSAIITLFDDTQ